MSIWSGLGISGTAAAGAAAAAVVAIGVVIGVQVFREDAPVAVPETAAVPGADVTVTAAAPPAADPVEPEPAAEPAPEPAPEPEAEPAAPGFDVVRVSPDGGALVAGRAAPLARVAVQLERAAIAT